MSKLIQVIGAPQASFIPSIDEGCAPLEVSFANTSIAEYSEYKWDYGQGDTSIGPTADTIVYQQGRHDTTYYVQLIISNHGKWAAKALESMFIMRHALTSTVH